MTREEQAIEHIKKYRELDEKLYNTAPKGTVSSIATKKCLEFWDMAISALEQQPCTDAVSREAVCDYIAEFVNDEYSTDAECEMVDAMIKGIQHLPPVNPQPCDDAISRQAALEAVSEGCQEWRGICGRCEELINALPSVTQKCEKCAMNGSGSKYCDNCGPKSGKWIPVSERLPEKDRKHNTFLVTDSGGNLSISKFYLPLSNSDIEKPYWSGMIDVIAWMPLPEPYDPQESEDV